MFTTLLIKAHSVINSPPFPCVIIIIRYILFLNTGEKYVSSANTTGDRRLRRPALLRAAKFETFESKRRATREVDGYYINENLQLHNFSPHNTSLSGYACKNCWLLNTEKENNEFPVSIAILVRGYPRVKLRYARSRVTALTCEHVHTPAACPNTFAMITS